RRRMTDAEQLVWHHLRNRSLVGWKFRRQHPIGPYVADFVCVEAALVVELDGGQHLDSAADDVRTSYLRSRGWRVLRFWNNDVLLRTELVMSVVYEALAEVRRG